jgi:uncharacterized protein YeeX (DUF496 family)
MEAQLTDLFYFVTVGNPSPKMSQKTKLTKALDKVFSIFLNVDDNKTNTSSKKDNSNKQSSSNSNTGPNDNNTAYIKSKQNSNGLIEHIESISSLYENVVVKYFVDREYLLELTEESREMRTKYCEIGELDTIRLLFPEAEQSNHGVTEIISLTGSGSGASVHLGDQTISVLTSGEKYQLSDTLIGFNDGSLHIFKPETLKNSEIKNSLIPISWNMPLHTQVYQFFRPTSFDVEKIKATQKMIEEHGLEFVIKLFVKEHLRL